MEHLQPKFELDQAYFLSLVNTKALAEKNQWITLHAYP